MGYLHSYTLGLQAHLDHDGLLMDWTTSRQSNLQLLACTARSVLLSLPCLFPTIYIVGISLGWDPMLANALLEGKTAASSVIELPPIAIGRSARSWPSLGLPE